MAEVKQSVATRTGIERLVSPFQRFAQTEASGGVVLLVCTGAALLWANSPWAHTYEALWHAPLTVGTSGVHLTMSIRHWVNDGLMAAFFFLIGLEVKRELLFGELASARRAALPMAAALGGMLVPAAIYALASGGGEALRGWAIPMATDIAFALGILALFGPGVPVQLKVFLAALAIADDIGAVLVITTFYTAGVSWTALTVAALVFGLVVLAARGGLRSPAAYALLGLPLWLALLASGIHASIAGVIMAAAIPARPDVDATQLVRRGKRAIEMLAQLAPHRSAPIPKEGELSAIRQLQRSARQGESVLQRLEHGLHPWIAFVVVPLFALANAGVGLAGIPRQGLYLAAAAAAALVLGKPLGIMGGSLLAARLGAERPDVGWKALAAVSCLGGIGFTMSIFIANLAFEDELLRAAKLGVLAGSALAAAAAALLLRKALPAGGRAASDGLRAR